MKRTEVLNVCKLFQNMAGQEFFDFCVAGNRLSHSGAGVLIPIVFAAVANEDAPHLLDTRNQLAPLQATSSSAALRTAGMLPLVSS